jgi:prolyl oligopeptidase
MASSKKQIDKARREDWPNDPYRWMEEDTPELRTWVNAQNEHTISQLSSLAVREAIRKRLEELMREPTRGTLTKAGERTFFRQRLKGNELPALYCQDFAVAEPRLLIDPNVLSHDRSITLGDIHPSNDGSLIAYRLSRAGSSGMSLHVMSVTSGKALPDTIPGDVNPVAHAWHTRNRVAWLPDSSGFYYTRCPHGLGGTATRFHHKLYFHRLGDDWREDKLVFGESLRREQAPYPQLSADGRFLVVVVQDLSGTTPRSEVYLLDREQSQHKFVAVVKDIDSFISATLHQNKVYLQSHNGLPGGLQVINLTDESVGDFIASTVIPAGAHPIRDWTVVRDYLFVETLEDVSSRLRVHDLAGNFLKQIELPDSSSLNSLTTDSQSQEIFISLSSFLTARTTYRVDLESLELTRNHRDEVAIDTAAFVTEQVWFESRDKTRIPMFLVHRKGINRDGKNPVVIHGYGGFGVSMLPKFTAHVIPFLEHGGIYAVVNARGGGEFGETWHRAGMRVDKQNTFDDFIAAGEYLIANRYTEASRLACFGWSNGGLSVNAVAVQRPDLWKAVVAGAPVTDLRRFHIAHGGQHWIAEYGSPKNSDDLNFLQRYSPYHTLPDSIDAPAVLTIVPDNDDRVATWHGYKMHAAWLAANISDHPILLRREEQAGHRGNPAVRRTIDRYADIWAFIFWQLGVV